MVEDKEATMIKFLNELNCEIKNIMELQHYMELNDMVYMSNKMERQLKRKGNGFPIQVKYGCRYKSYKDKKDIYMDNRGKSKTQTLYNRDKKCFLLFGSRSHYFIMSK